MKTPWKTWKVSEKSMQGRKIQDSASGKEWNTDLNLLPPTIKSIRSRENHTLMEKNRLLNRKV